MKIHKIVISLTLSAFVYSNTYAIEDIGVPQHKPQNVKRAMAGGCTVDLGAAFLSINNVRARITDEGDMWWNLNPAASLQEYFEPASGNVCPEFAGALWVAGEDAGGQLKVAAMTYRQNGVDFWAGPLDTANVSISLAECQKYDKLFYVTRQEVQNFVDYYHQNPAYLTSDIKNWPGNGDPAYNEGHYLAPFVDVGGTGVYDPTLGDYPGYDLKGTNTSCENELFGDATLWYVINDEGNIHTESGGLPIGLEIRVQAFEFNTTDAINNCTFYNYQIINRSSFTVNNCYFGAWNDFDLGDGAFNYTGCDVSRSMGYGYESQNTNPDGSGNFAGEKGYGNDLPAIGEVFFQGPFADKDDSALCYVHNGRIGMARFVYYNNDFTNQGNPINATSYYNYLRGLWIDGTPMTYGGSGYQSSTTACSYMFPWTPAGASPGSPITNTDPTGCGTNGIPQTSPWNEVTANDPGGDRRFLESAGPFTLKPGAVNYVTTGLVWDMTSILNNQFLSISLIQQDADLAQALFNNCFKVLNGPDAPDMSVQELNNEVILTLSNQPTSNNYKEQYAERSPTIVYPPYKDTMYTFEGYEIFQLLDSSITATELLNPQDARLVAECNVNNDGVTQLVNWTTGSNGFPVGTPEVSLSTTGIVHSFDIKEDYFQEDGQTTLVNNRPYYYMVIAFGYNNYTTYVNGGSDSLQKGQQMPFLQGRNNTRVYTAIPHNPIAQDNGTVQNSNYGEGLAITRLEGHGNGNNAIDLNSASSAYILQNDTMAHPTYMPGQGPINVKIVDPLSVPNDNFVFQMMKGVNANGMDSTARWKIYIQGQTGDTIYSDTIIGYQDEQIIPQWGISISVQDVDLPLIANSLDSTVRHNIILDSSCSMTFSDPTKTWLTGVKSASPGENLLFWIRCGDYYDDPTKGGTPDGAFSSDAVPGNPPTIFVDPNCWYSSILGGTWGPYDLCATSSTKSPYSCDNGPKWGGAIQLSSLKTLSNVDLIITSNKADWTRCVVLEEQDQPLLAEGNGRKMYPRVSESVDQNGNYATPGSGAEFTDPTLPNYISETGMGWFPGYAINVETGERLNMAFGEDSWLTQDNGRDMIWNPDTVVTRQNNGSYFGEESVFGGKHYIYIFAHDTGLRFRPNTPPRAVIPIYDHDSTMIKYFGYNQVDSIGEIYASCMWVNIPLRASGHKLLESDVTIHLRVAKPYQVNWGGANWKNPNPVNNNYPMYLFNSDGLGVETNDQSAAKNALSLINVVPNPYYGYSSYESDRIDTRVRITNLPPTCNISIFSLSGTLVAVINKESPETYVDWNLQNQFNVPIASGIYLIHVTVPNVGEVTLKWFGVMRPLDLGSY